MQGDGQGHWDSARGCQRAHRNAGGRAHGENGSADTHICHVSSRFAGKAFKKTKNKNTTIKEKTFSSFSKSKEICSHPRVSGFFLVTFPGHMQGWGVSMIFEVRFDFNPKHLLIRNRSVWILALNINKIKSPTADNSQWQSSHPPHICAFISTDRLFFLFILRTPTVSLHVNHAIQAIKAHHINLIETY